MILVVASVLLRLLMRKDLLLNQVPRRALLNLSLQEVENLYQDFYADAPFTHVSKSNIDLKQVVNTNKCLIHLEKHGNKLMILSIIDNLLKGASGQAVQNMNIIFGLEENTGLKLKTVAY